MAELELNGISRGALGDVLMDAIDLASDQDQMTWLVSDGKRIAAIVPVDDGERAEWAHVQAATYEVKTGTELGRAPGMYRVRRGES